MDRQYQEFISLLQYFVYIQEAKIPAAHLIHKGGHEFVILNDRMEPIDANEFDASFRNGDVGEGHQFRGYDREYTDHGLSCQHLHSYKGS